jgi:hypothetical protein
MAGPLGVLSASPCVHQAAAQGVSVMRLPQPPVPSSQQYVAGLLGSCGRLAANLLASLCSSIRGRDL